MKTLLTTAVIMAFVVILNTTPAKGAGYCPPVGCPEPVRTVNVQVPVTTYVDEQYPVKVTRMVPVEREVSVNCGRWVTEQRQVPTTRTIYVNEPYTAYETRYQTRPETRTRKVAKTICVNETRQVCKKVYDKVCDPCTGKTTKVARTVYNTVNRPVKRRIYVDQEYTVNVRCPVTVPVTKTRKVAQRVQSTRMVSERRWIPETATRKVVTMEPVVETRMETRRRAVCTLQTRQVPVAPSPCPVL